MKNLKLLTRTVGLAILIFTNFIILNAQNELQKGTRITLRMDNGISSASSGVNDTFTAVTIKPLVIDGVTYLPAETTVVGRITDVTTAGSAGKSGTLSVSFDLIKLPGGLERRISAVLVEEFPIEKSGVFNTLSVIGGTAIGGLIGLLTKADNGAVIGAGIGAGAGTGIALSRKGKNVGIDSNKLFEIELTEKVQLPTDGY